jgi:hypothetical protein
MQKIVDGLRSFDLLLFAGSDVFPSRIIEYILGTNYSHIGLVVVNPSFCSPQSGVFFIESGEETTPDASSGKRKWGVRATVLDSTFLATYPGRVFRRRAVWSNVQAQEAAQQALECAWTKVHEATYDCNVADAYEAARHKVIHGDGRRTDTFVCSTFAAFILTSINALDKNTTAWDTFSPKDFIPGGRVDSLLRDNNSALIYDADAILLTA